ncbi:TRM2 [Mytilus edulis]|uniref:tRNA (uracil(54)-C(5))-methyltransferase n=1 Tax=Mytilus edulis TaxID=6550 RepID=A0A8S3UZH6_MYTED|nr:TRM2 [Mytilus edulis]
MIRDINLFSHNLISGPRLKQIVRHMTKIFRFAQNNRPGYMKSFTYENQYLRLADVVEPLWQRSYESQLSMKKHLVEKCMRKVFHILKDHKGLKIEDHPFLQTMKTEYGEKMCPVEDTIPSPVTKGYRYKNTCNLGPDIKGDRRTLGLYVGRSFDKTLTCVQPYFLSILSDRHKEIFKVAQEFLYQSSYEPKFKVEPHGNWKSVVVRSTTTGQDMVIFLFHPQRNSKEFIDGAKEEILQYFVHGPGKQSDIDSIYFQSSHRRFPTNDDFPHELLHGIPVLTENLMGSKFQISPTSFFQGNVPCAEVLYSKVLDLGEVGPQTTVLDICCGTGTIGILAARRAKQVYGVDITSQAVEDAKSNAIYNGLSNTEFICNKAHRMLRELVQSNKLGEDVVAILNPGRAGANKKLIESIRNCQKINKVIYISCKPVGNVLSNFINLIVPPNEIFYGKPFRPVVTVPVDMFPQTNHCEIIVLFER